LAKNTLISALKKYAATSSAAVCGLSIVQALVQGAELGADCLLSQDLDDSSKLEQLAALLKR
jgi:hypothetical protein